MVTVSGQEVPPATQDYPSDPTKLPKVSQESRPSDSPTVSPQKNRIPPTAPEAPHTLINLNYEFTQMPSQHVSQGESQALGTCVFDEPELGVSPNSSLPKSIQNSQVKSPGIRHDKSISQEITGNLSAEIQNTSIVMEPQPTLGLELEQAEPSQSQGDGSIRLSYTLMSDSDDEPLSVHFARRSVRPSENTPLPVNSQGEYVPSSVPVSPVKPKTPAKTPSKARSKARSKAQLKNPSKKGLRRPSPDPWLPSNERSSSRRKSLKRKGFSYAESPPTPRQKTLQKLKLFPHYKGKVGQVLQVPKPPPLSTILGLPKEKTTKSKNVKPSKPIEPVIIAGHCNHCEAKKSQVWNNGPDGENTLCSACGSYYEIHSTLEGLVPKSKPVDTEQTLANLFEDVVTQRRIQAIVNATISIEYQVDDAVFALYHTPQSAIYYTGKIVEIISKNQFKIRFYDDHVQITDKSYICPRDLVPGDLVLTTLWNAAQYLPAMVIETDQANVRVISNGEVFSKPWETLFLDEALVYRLRGRSRGVVVEEPTESLLSEIASVNPSQQTELPEEDAPVESLDAANAQETNDAQRADIPEDTASIEPSESKKGRKPPPRHVGPKKPKRLPPQRKPKVVVVEEAHVETLEEAPVEIVQDPVENPVEAPVESPVSLKRKRVPPQRKPKIPVEALVPHAKASEKPLVPELLFAGHTFVVTDVREKDPNKICSVCSLVPPKSGTLPPCGAMVDDVIKSDSILLASRPMRTPKYLWALATGIEILSIQWVVESLKAGKILEKEYYRLPTGFSKELSTFVSPPRRPGGVFQGQHVVIYTSLKDDECDFRDIWEPVLKAAGAIIINTRQIATGPCDFVLCETYPGNAINTTLSQVQDRLVTKEFVVECLINQRMIPQDKYRPTQ